MRKMMIVIATSLTLLQGCVPNMVVHTGGRSGTFNESTAKNLTANINDCNDIVNKNVIQTLDYSKYVMRKYWEAVSLGLIKAGEPKSKTMKRKCLETLGHAVLD
tara:strand:+ start:598 stop:909 length:312 start_codon:yes stop_codon:yes gene_type:complete